MTGPRSTRESLLARAVSPRRLEAARIADHRFETFCKRLQISRSAEAMVLYLTWVSEETDCSGPELRRWLELLDVQARIRHEEPWSASGMVREYLRGFSREHPMTASPPRSMPLYRELVRALVDAIMSPTRAQLRDEAIVLLAIETRLPIRAIAALNWCNIRLSRHEMIVSPSARASECPQQVIAVPARARACAVSAMRAWKFRAGLQAGNAFGLSGGKWAQTWVGMLLSQHLPERNPHRPENFCVTPDVAQRIVASIRNAQPRQLRDRAILLFGYLGALGTTEAVELTQGDVRVTAAGLAIRIRRRRCSLMISAEPESAYCPVVAWESWMAAARSQRMAVPRYPAFLKCSGSVLSPDHPSAAVALNLLVHQRADDAGLIGHYTWTSLRSGLIRSSLREDAEPYVIAAHAGLRALSSLGRHEQRERIINASVAGRLGL
jgi:integrase